MAAGANADLALPLDYRSLLLPRRPGGDSASALSDSNSAAAAPADLGRAASTLLTLLQLQQREREQEQEQQDQEQLQGQVERDAEGGDAASGDGEGQLAATGGEGWLEGLAPPPKRGRYVTVGAAPLRPPSLQYCTALGLAALGGHAEVVSALLARGQVSSRGGPRRVYLQAGLQI